jgi:hypothetical protein
MDDSIDNELASGERLLWGGRPKRGIRLCGADLYAIPFSLIWFGFVIFWEISVLNRHAPFFFALWGVPFIGAGLYFVFGRFFADALARDRTFYGVTNERVIIITGLFSRQIKSLQFRTLCDISLTERSDGSGTITFGRQSPMTVFLPPSWPGARRYAAPSFEMIEEAKAVYELVRKAQIAAP